jgi:lipopolysaccharide transport system ATP-binding protein
MHFQKKSLDRMMGFRKSGKTVLFCSHNMYQVRSLCQRALWLRDGNMEAIGDTEEVVAAYEAYQLKKESPEEVDAESELVLDNLLPAEAGSSSPARLISVAVLDHNGQETTRLETRSDSSVAIEVEVVQPGIPFHLALVVQRNDNINIFFTTTAADGMPPISAKKNARAVLSLPGFPLLSGDYMLCVYVLDDHAIQVYDMAEGICPFTVRSNPSEMGIVTLSHHWHVESDEANRE